MFAPENLVQGIVSILTIQWPYGYIFSKLCDHQKQNCIWIYCFQWKPILYGIWNFIQADFHIILQRDLLNILMQYSFLYKLENTIIREKYQSFMVYPILFQIDGILIG